MKCWHGGSVARGEASFSCSILCPIYLKCRTSANIAFLFVCHKWTSFFDKMFLLVRKRWVHKTASSTRINGSCKHFPSKKFSHLNGKNSVFNPSKYFLALQKVNLSILSTFERSFSKKLEKTPSSPIIHSLGVEYCWIVHDSEPIKLLKSPRSLSGYILIWNIGNSSVYLAVRSTCEACAARATNRNKPHLTQNPLISYEERLPLKTSALQFYRVVDWP